MRPFSPQKSELGDLLGYRPAYEKVPNKNLVLTFWRTLRKLGQDKRLSGELYTKSYIIAYAQGCLKMVPQ